ncbi:MAG TPA: hypothetical protein VJ461_05030 [Candidatus Nanoarchaeia archaeon]|nr:hypothetical protein [Candidatus Nanoarchaeia archaeon]
MAKKEAKKEGKVQGMEGASKEEQTGFHKGSLSTLAKERQELARLLQIVEQLMQLHIAALKELGVDLENEAKEAMQPTLKKPEKPIEDML